MSALTLGVALSNEVGVAETVALARRAEELGYAAVWVPESSHGRSATSVTAVLAEATSTIGLGVGVVNPFWRHPSLIAMEAATLDEASGGRFRIGLGAALWTLRALGEADERTQRPLTAMVEAIRVVKALLSGADGVEGKVFPVKATARLDFEPPRRDIPVYVGAVNERMLEATGAWADGVYLGAITTPGYARWALEQVAAGARSRGRDPEELRACANVLVSVSEDERAARDSVRQVLAYYLDRVEAVVRDHSGADPEALGFVRRLAQERGARAAAEQLPEELIDVFAAAGVPEQVAARLSEFGTVGVDLPLVWHVFGPDPDAGLRLLAEATGAYAG